MAWKKKANLQAWEAYENYQKLDRHHLERKRHGKVIQNMALEAQYKIEVKKPKAI
jgi:hypothetical protein